MLFLDLKGNGVYGNVRYSIKNMRVATATAERVLKKNIPRLKRSQACMRTIIAARWLEAWLLPEMNRPVRYLSTVSMFQSCISTFKL